MLFPKFYSRADSPATLRLLLLSGTHNWRTLVFFGLIERAGLVSGPLQVERGRVPGLADELFHRAHLLFQHHPGQPVSRRSPLPGHVPKDRGD